ncbi:primosomal protein N' [uncultured Jatrophihabitans sp.]|uniref:primosomal protein N' n=1 Tax=uncultured Jatrophihabitans sp. TaxID=1610747 RepID=UPI0035C9B511
MSSGAGAGPAASRTPASVDPVASLYVDVPLPHLDRTFDYLVPDSLDEQVQAGSRVRVRFAGRLVDAYVISRSPASEHEGTLAYVERAVGAEPVLTAETTALFRAVADRWAGNFVDVVRLGVPARHARAESAAAPSPAGELPPAADSGFERYRAGPSYLTAVGDGRPARAVWSALPGEDWAARFAAAAAIAVRAGRGAILVVPDNRDLARLDAAMTAALGIGRHVVLAADLGPPERYRRWLAVRRGGVRVAIGTRAAAYAPVDELGLVAVWDDGDDLHAEPRAPYPHTRDILTLRSAQSGAALLIGGFARTAEAQQLVAAGWAHDIAADRTTLRAAAPRVQAVADDVEVARDPAAAAARLPSLAWRTTKQALQDGRPVLVQVPRRGYVPSLACARDRTPARCGVCSGPLGSAGSQAVPACRWCGRPAAQWACPTCGGHRLRALVVGAGRTAEELGRAFAGFAVRTSGGDHVLADVGDEPALVVATPGAEPTAAGGYGAALLLDGWALLARPDLRAAEEALRRWMNAAALVRPDGAVIVGADAGVPVVQALIRWDPVGAAVRELAERAELGFPPAVRMAALTGPAPAVAELVAGLSLPAGGELLGSAPVAAAGVSGEPAERVLLRVPRGDGADLARQLHVSAAARSARRSAEPVRIELDPAALG